MQMSTSSLLDELSLLSSSYKTRTSSVNSRLKIKAFLYEGGREGEREGAREGEREGAKDERGREGGTTFIVNKLVFRVLPVSRGHFPA